MKSSFYSLLFVSLLAVAAWAGEPARALCMICALRGETEQEEVVATRDYKEKTYSFCSEKCAKEFAEDPDAYVYELPRAAPDLALATLQGGSVSLESLKGEWVVVDFWATWCKPCVTTMPELDAWSKTGDVRVVGIAIDEGKDHEKKVKKFLEKNPVTYPIALDVADKPVWQSYKVKILPTVLLIDPSGQIVARQVGKVDLAALRTMVAAGKKD